MWVPPPRQPFLEQGRVHVWRASLSLPAAAQMRCESLLSADEHEQCSRYVQSVDRVRAAAARGSLRIVLAKYTDEDPRALPIATGAYGKPFLERTAEIQFNISHTDDRALIAVSRGIRVGIDIERIREVRNLDTILDAFFGDEERASLLPREGRDRTRAFFVLWTRREACAKAMGLDLFDFLARFTLAPFDRNESGTRVELAPAAAPTREAEVWWMRDISPARGYAGALCTERENPTPSFWNLLIH
jgi:4'-phosphopantetheinyl transferase